MADQQPSPAAAEPADGDAPDPLAQDRAAAGMCAEARAEWLDDIEAALGFQRPEGSQVVSINGVECQVLPCPTKALVVDIQKTAGMSIGQLFNAEAAAAGPFQCMAFAALVHLR